MLSPSARNLHSASQPFCCTRYIETARSREKSQGLVLRLPRRSRGRAPVGLPDAHGVLREAPLLQVRRFVHARQRLRKLRQRLRRDPSGNQPIVTTIVSIIRLCTTAQGQAAQRQVLHDVQAPGRRQVQALLQVLREQRGLHRQLRPLHARGVMSRGDFPSRSASFIGCITGHKGKGDEYHRCKPHSETNED